MCEKQVHCSVWSKCELSSVFLQLRLFQSWPASLCFWLHLRGRALGPHTLYNITFPEEAGDVNMCLLLILWLCVLLCPLLCWMPSSVLPVLKSYFSFKGQPLSCLPRLPWAEPPPLSIVCPEGFIWDSRVVLAPSLYCDSYLLILGGLRTLPVNLCFHCFCCLQVGMFGGGVCVYS